LQKPNRIFYFVIIKLKNNISLLNYIDRFSYRIWAA